MGTRAAQIAPLFLFLAAALLTADPASAATQPPQERLCDPAFEDCRSVILTYIQQETVAIDAGFWMMTDGRYATALVAAWNRGVRVRLLMDPRCVDSHENCAPQNAQLAQAGIPMRKRLAGGILHWKVMVFAGQGQVQFAGANYAPFEMTPEIPFVNYTDEIVYFTNSPSLVHSFMTKFDDLWTNVNEFGNYANAAAALRRSYPTYPIDPELNFPPDDSYRSRSLAAYTAERRAIDVLMFRITDERQSDGIIDAVRRGVPVRLITDSEEYRNPDRLWDAYNVDKMYRAGVQIRVDAHLGINHEKAVILAGSRLAIFGSSNWTSPSSDSQREHNLFTTRPAIVDWLSAQFTRKWTNATGNAETTPFAPLPPDVPVYASPANGSVGVPASGVSLAWNGGLWAHQYDIYFGTSPTPPLVAANSNLGPSQSAGDYRGYALPPLQPGTRYYWRIVSSTMAGVREEGPVWSFTTAGPRLLVPDPHMAVDMPGPNTVVRQPFGVSGWALDAAAAAGNGVDVVHLWAYPAAGGAPIFVGWAPVGGARDDLGALYGTRFRSSGYWLWVRGLAPADYTLAVFAHSTVSGTFAASWAVPVRVAPAAVVVLDSPRPDSTVGAGFMVGGWAVDFGAASGPGVDVVHVWAYPLDAAGGPIFVGQSFMQTRRPDIAAAFGAQFAQSGFSLLAPALPRGRYRIVAFGRSVLSGTFSATAVADVTLR